MDKEYAPVLQELNNMQLKISYLFLDLIKEKNEHKQNSENLSKKLKQLSDEAENLKKQNETLKQCNEDMKNIIENGITVLKSLDLSSANIFGDHKILLERLKKTFFGFGKKVENFKTTELTLKNSLESEEKEVNIDTTRYILSDEEIQKEFEGLNDLNFTNFSYNEADEKNSPGRDSVLDTNRSITVLKSFCQNNSNITSKELSSDFENESLASKSAITTVDAKISTLSSFSLEMESCGNRSPVFKDFGIRKQGSLINDENGSNSSKSSQLINEKFLEKSDGLLISPWKKSPGRPNEITPKKKSPAPRRARKRLKINSSERSPFSLLKNSNMREAEISFLGIRKLRQTLLNVDCYKKKSSENREHDNYGSVDSNKKENKVVIVDEEDDDFITESPKKDDQTLEDVKIKKSKRDLKVPFITLPQTSDADLDETYISSSLIQKCNKIDKLEFEKVISQQTPLKREKSPDYCSVPFVYKREPVRKKVERMKLPGHACLECLKYYENAFGNINAQDLKKVLNKCSRHRDKNSPTLDDTPPGYWKPYLTCSTIISPNKDDVFKAVIN